MAANNVTAPLIRTNKTDMEISERAAQLTPSLTLSIDSKAKAMKAEGIDVCGFGAGEPDFDTPEHIKAAAIEALQAGFTKYTPSAGIPELRAAIAEKLAADNELTYRAGQVIISNGAKHACYNAILATCQPGDEVIIPAPYWVSYPDMVRLVGAEPVIVPTMERNNWKMRAEDFENAMTPRTKMLIMNTPCNPTGSVYTREELEAIVEVASGEDIYILSDEIYEKLVYDDAKHVSIGSLSKEAYDLTITVNGFSKSYAMTGWRLGYLAAPEAVAKAVDSIQSHTTANPSSFSQRGALAALKGDQQSVSDMRDEFDMRRNYMLDRLSKIPNVTAVKPQGAFYVLLNVGQLGLTSQNFADRLLSKANVAVVPGAAFGDDRTIRLSYATSIDIIKKGLDRLQDFCRTL
jgi:aspartate aminotransferase